MTAYSSTPLPRKLGIKAGARIVLVHAPPDFMQTLGPLPLGAQLVGGADSQLDLALLFVRREDELRAQFFPLAARLAPAGMLWVAWPKQAAKVPTDLTESLVQRIGLDAGLVDTKVCAIDAVWSGLRFVIWLKDRQRKHTA